MTPLTAIKTCLAKSFQFSGRASRAEFWWFAPFGIAPPVIVGMQITWFNMDFWGLWRIGYMLPPSLPLLAVLSRRLQDIGEPGEEAFYPFMPFVILWVGYQLTSGFIDSTAFTGLDGIGLVVAIVAFLLAIPFCFIALIVTLNLAASTIGKTFISSQPGPNRYGPNPLEVTP